MKKICLLAVYVSLSTININAESINFPPELLWWIYEVKKANPNIEIKDFTSSDKEIIKFGVDSYYQGGLKYPVFMRWNYSGNFVAYSNFNGAYLTRSKSGKYFVGDFDDNNILYIADRNKNNFFIDFLGVKSALCAIYWLTDTVLTGVGLNVNNDEIFNVDLFIVEYKIINSNKTIEKKYYFCGNALKNDDREFLKLFWYEQRPDYFEIRKQD